MVVDYSQIINRCTLLDAYPLPKINKIIAQITKGSIYGTLDVKSANYQIPLTPEDCLLTAFKAYGKLYQYIRQPLGVTNSVSFF